MIKIYYPTHPFKLREPEKHKEEIWDDLRRQWVRLHREPVPRLYCHAVAFH